MGAGPLARARRVLGEWYVMPRHVARYFMRRRHHRRRIPAASRYISGCTVNPSSPAVRQLHRGRSSEFRERSSSSARLLSPSPVLAMCVCPCVSVSDRVPSLFFLAVVARVRLSFSPEYPITLSRALRRALSSSVVRDLFSFLNSFCHPRSLLFSISRIYRVL